MCRVTMRSENIYSHQGNAVSPQERAHPNHQTANLPYLEAPQKDMLLHPSIMYIQNIALFMNPAMSQTSIHMSSLGC